MFEEVLSFDFSDELKAKLRVLAERDKRRAEILRKKVLEVVSRNEETIGYYKNLRAGLKEFKRVHVDKSFVLTFKFDAKKNFVLFTDFDHHDVIYKK